MTFEVRFAHFRIFEDTGFVPIRPITLLTGGNSAGKTSFLAALKYLSDMDAMSGRSSSFNRDPFMLGAYEQIAYFKGGRHGRAKNFEFCFKGPMRDLMGRPSRRDAPAGSFTLRFAKKLSQPVLQEISFLSENASFRFVISDDWRNAKVEANFESEGFARDVVLEKFLNPEVISQNPGFVTLYLQSFLTDPDPREESGSAGIIRRVLGEVDEQVRSAIGSVPPSSYAGGPVRTRPLRTYDPIGTAASSEGANVPSQMAQLARTSPAEWQRLYRGLVDFGKSSALFSDIEVRSLGRSDSDPFQINIVINGPKRNIIDVGYGVSQAIPLVYELLRRGRETLYIAQQPEVHLHPEAQAALATLIVEESRRQRGYIVVETHSDYLIDRVRRHVREKLISPDDLSILYFSRREHDSLVSQVRLTSDGEVVDPPDGYRDFFLKEQIENLGF